MASLGTVGKGDHIRPYRNCRLKHFPEDATQTFRIGDPLILGGAGLENKVKIAGDNPTADIVGVAAEAASGVTGKKVAVWLAEPHAEFLARGDATDTVDFTDIGALRALEIDAANEIWRVETDDAGNDSVVVLGFLDPITREPLTAEGATDPLVIFRFAEAACVWGDANT